MQDTSNAKNPNQDVATPTRIIRVIVPDNDGPHPPKNVPEDVFRLIRAAYINNDGGDLYFRARSHSVGPHAMKLCIYAYGTLETARMCPSEPYDPWNDENCAAFGEDIVFAPSSAIGERWYRLTPNNENIIFVCFSGNGIEGVENGFEAVYMWIPKPGVEIKDEAA